jgi:hypothetical protein
LTVVDPGLALVIASFVTPIVSVLLYYQQATSAKKSEMDKEARQRVAEKYETIVEEIPFVFFAQIRDKLSADDQLKHKRCFFGQYGHIWLHSVSDDTIRRLNDVIALYSVTPPLDKAGKTVAQFIVAARREIHGKTTLTAEDYRFVAV